MTEGAEKNIREIRFNRDMIKEFQGRDRYTKIIQEIFRRKDAGECPRCGVRKWILRGSGFHKKWMCDDCGFKVSKKDLYKGNIYYEFVEFYARKERKRRKDHKRYSQTAKTYRSDVYEVDEK